MIERRHQRKTIKVELERYWIIFQNGYLCREIYKGIFMSKFEILEGGSKKISKYELPIDSYFDVVELAGDDENYIPSFKAAYCCLEFADRFIHSWQYYHDEDTLNEMQEWSLKAFEICNRNLSAFRAFYLLGSLPRTSNYNIVKYKKITDKKVCILENCLMIRHEFIKIGVFDKPILAGEAVKLLEEIYKLLSIPYTVSVKDLNSLAFDVISKNVRTDKGIPEKHYIFSQLSEDSKKLVDLSLFHVYLALELNIKIPEGYEVATLD